MKTKILLATCILAASTAFGQMENQAQKSEEAIITPPVFMSDYFNKSTLINAYFQNNMEYPSTALKYNVQGIHEVSFNVQPNGDISDVKILSGVSPEIDMEVVRVLKTTSGMWRPGFIDDKPATMKKVISVAFQIYSGDNKSGSPLKEHATAFYKKGNEALLIENNPAKALKYFDKALKFIPNETTVLYARGMARLKLKDNDGAQQDWDRVNALNQEKLNEKRNQFVTENIIK